jgi:hypothetical protein
MEYFFQTKKIPIWLYFEGPLSGKCWYILWPFGIFYGHFVFLWSFVAHISRFGVLYQEKSGNPD